jgi:type III secretion system YscJ/HrcJ family lipoprotein
MKRLNSVLLVLVCLFALSACKETAIVHDLEERDANEILVVLAKHDITAKKDKVEKNQAVTWFITVNPSDEMAARSILVANNLPKVRHGGLSGICKDAGLILTPKTEKCREILAYKGEIINSLESIPGVVSADVVLNIPDKDEFPDANSVPPRPTAAVTIQYLKDGRTTTTLSEGKVQEFVSNSVNGLDARDVAVIISYFESGVPMAGDAPEAAATKDAPLVSGTTGTADVVQMPDTVEPDEVPDLKTIGGLKMDSSSAKKFKVVAVLFLVLFLLITGAFLYVLLKMARLKKQVPIVADEDDVDHKLLGT